MFSWPNKLGDIGVTVSYNKVYNKVWYTLTGRYDRLYSFDIIALVFVNSEILYC